MNEKSKWFRAITKLWCAVVTVCLLTPPVVLARGVQTRRAAPTSGEPKQRANEPDGTEEANKEGERPVSIEQLRRRVDEIERVARAEIEQLRLLVLQQAAELASLRQQPPASQPSPQSVAENRPLQTSTQSQPQIPSTQTGPPPQREISGAAERNTFRRDNESVARVHNTPLHPSAAGFFDIPGTPARIKFDGYFKLDTIIDPRPAGDPDQFNTAKIPISQPGQPQPANVTVIARQTRFNLDLRSPVRNSEQDARFFFEFDFYGTDGALDPRLRHAYGQYKNFLAGFTWSTFTDPDAFPDTLDFEMPAGISDLRQAQARFTIPLSESNSLVFAVEQPGTTAARTLFTNGKPYNPAPDSVIRWRYENKRGHIQVGSVLRALGYQDDTRSQTVFGYGMQVSTALKTFGLDSLQLYGSYGKGYSRYIKNISSYDVDLDNSGNNIRAMPALGTYLGYTHHWTHPLRSTITFGYDRVQNTAPQPGTAFSKSYYTSGNLVWNPIGHLNLGAEFLHGWQVLKDGSQGNANRIQLSVKYDLYRKE